MRFLWSVSLKRKIVLQGNTFNFLYYMYPLWNSLICCVAEFKWNWDCLYFVPFLEINRSGFIYIWYNCLVLNLVVKQKQSFEFNYHRLCTGKCIYIYVQYVWTKTKTTLNSTNRCPFLWDTHVEKLADVWNNRKLGFY